ncbi:MAG: WD40 repeat domain-containing protein [Spirochaetaceae bacterium]|nr:MAG: WD40 repeat domain-containing protein [Spirochaetaceae bacterium]
MKKPYQNIIFFFVCLAYFTANGYGGPSWEAPYIPRSFTPQSRTIADDNTSFHVDKRTPDIDYGQYRENRDFELVINRGHNQYIEKLYFSPDSRYILSVSNVLKLWNLEGNLIRQFPECATCGFSPDGKFILTYNRNGIFRKYSLDGKVVSEFSIKNDSQIYDAKISNDWSYIVNCTERELEIYSLQGVLLNTLRSHADYIRSFDISQDNEHIASTGTDHICRIWHREKGLLNSIKYEDGSLWDNLRFNPSGDRIAFPSSDNSISIYSLNGDLKSKIKYEGKYSIFSLVWSPDGKYILTQGSDTKPGEDRFNDKWPIKIWNLDGKLIRELNAHDKSDNAITISPNGSFIATTGTDQVVRIFDPNFRLIAECIGSYHDCYALAASPDNSYFISGGRDGILRFWSPEKGLLHANKAHDNGIISVSISPDSKYILTSSWDKTAKIWTREGSLVKTLEGYSRPVIFAAWINDGQNIVTADFVRKIKMWDGSGNFIKDITINSDYSCIDVSPDGKYILLGEYSGGDNEIVIDGRPSLFTLDGKKVFQLPKDGLGFVRVSPDSKYFFLSSYKTTNIYDINGKKISSFQAPYQSRGNGIIAYPGIHPHMPYIAYGYADGSVNIYSFDGTLYKTLEGPHGNIISTCFSTDGRFLFCGYDTGMIAVWNLKTGAQVFFYSENTEWAMFTQDCYYTASIDGTKPFLLIKGMDIFTLDDYRERFNRPDIIRQRMAQQ